VLYNNDTVNEKFDKFYCTFSREAEKHAPLRKASRKEKHHIKPWLSRGIIKSIKQKKKLLTQLIKIIVKIRLIQKNFEQKTSKYSQQDNQNG